MANGDLVARLRLDSKEFDNSISRSRRQVNDFQRNTDSFASAGIKAFAGFAGGVLAGAATLETFNKFMNSTQTTADFLNNNMLAASETVDAFFRSLNSGDWSAFANGFVDAYKNMKEFADLMDELDDKKLSLSYIKAEDMTDLARFEEIAKDTTKSYEERINATQNYEGVVNHLAKKTKETLQFELRTLNKNYASASGLDIKTDDLKYFFRHTNFSGELTSKASSAYNEYVKLNNEAEKLKKNAEYDAKQFGYDPSRQAQKEYIERKKIADLYRKENEFLIKQGWLAEDGDERRKKTVETLKEQLTAEEELYRQQIKADKIRKNVTKGEDSATKSATSTTKEKTKEVETKEGSIADIERKLTKLKNDLKNATTDEARRLITIQINHLEGVLAEINAKIKKFSVQNILDSNSKVNGKQTKFRNATDDIRSGYVNTKDLFNLGDDNKEQQSTTLDYLTGMRDLMYQVGNASSAASSNWLGYVGNVLAGVEQLIPQLWALLGINTHLAVVNQATKPFPLNVIAMLGTVSALGSALASVPKFAEGGIVPGNSFSGDKIMASVNSGEMILNKGQQANLFNMLNSGSVGGSSAGAGEVQFKVQGKDLVGVLTNYNNKFSRI